MNDIYISKPSLQGTQQEGKSASKQRRGSARFLIASASASILLLALPLPLPLPPFKHRFRFRFRASDTSFLSILNILMPMGGSVGMSASIWKKNQKTKLKKSWILLKLLILITMTGIEILFWIKCVFFLSNQKLVVKIVLLLLLVYLLYFSKERWLAYKRKF